MKLLPMFKQSLLCYLLFVGAICSAQVTPDGYIPVEEGIRVPSTWGVSWPYAGGYAQVIIQDGKFTLFFLDADRKLRRVNDIELALVHARQVGNKGLFSPFHLQRSSNGLYFQNQRHVYEPHQYDVKVDLRKIVGNKHRFRMKRSEKRSDLRNVKDSLEVKRLDQRDWPVGQ
ncbi:hypothetical protein F7C95_04530 [Opitutia bacterium ISCC 51]|nr:hypothetical protein F7C95_04530 [Opitutae bacterium ISCC 51]QXD29243.1 hypothetical protein GA003_04510 [Opitutae bacterium ISCC 52]